MFEGSIVALVTPFTAKGKIDEKALETLISWHLQSGTDGIACCGTTGEAPTLSDEEKLSLFDLCVQMAKKRMKVIAGTGTNDTKKSVYLTEQALKKGADGCLVVVPYYNRPTQAGCVAHFRAIAEVGLPVIVYHHPGRTGVTLTKETFGLLSQIPSVTAIKEASASLDMVKEIQKGCSLPILSGDDLLTVSVMEEGGKGVISVVANILPREWKRIVSLCQQGLFSEAKKEISLYEPFVKALFAETNPQGIKYALSIIGKGSPSLRLPLIEPSLAAQERIRKEMKALHAFYQILDLFHN